MIQEIYGKGLEPVDILRLFIEELKADKSNSVSATSQRTNWATDWGQPKPSQGRFGYDKSSLVLKSTAARMRKKSIRRMIREAVDGLLLAVGWKGRELKLVPSDSWAHFDPDTEIKSPFHVSLLGADFSSVRFVRFEDLTPDEREIWDTPSYNENKPLNVKYERTLLLFIAALLKDKNYTGTDRSETGKLERMLELQGVPLDAKTIRKVTKAAFTELNEHTEIR